MPKKPKKVRKLSKQKLETSVNKTKTQFRLRALLAGTITTIGVVGTLVAFWPRPVVSASDPVDLDNPFSASFTITNNNVVPLHNLDVSVALGNIKTAKNIILQGSDKQFRSLLRRPEWTHQQLDMDEKFSITIADLFNVRTNPVIEAKIRIHVSYNPWLLHFIKRQKSFGFELKRQTNNKLYWYSIS